MTTYNIYNQLGDLAKTVTVNSEEEVQDMIYDMREYHGFQTNYTYKEVK